VFSFKYFDGVLKVAGRAFIDFLWLSVLAFGETEECFI